MADDNVVGFDKESKQVVMGWLNMKTKDLDVISVLGMDRLRNTTLVKKIFNDQSIQYDFPILSFVSVSQVYSTRQVFLKILCDVTRVSKDTSLWSVETISHELCSQ